MSYWPYHKLTRLDFPYCCSLGTDERLLVVANSENNYSRIDKGAFTYDVSCSRGARGFKMLTVADKGGGGLSLADVSKNT